MSKRKVPGAWVNSSEADAIAKFYSEGHTTRETMERFGVNKGQIANLRKARGLSNGRTFLKGATIENDNRTKEAKQRLIKHLNEKGFEYISGYTNKGGNVTIKCCKCGTIYERSASHASKGNLVCVECQKAETQHRNEKIKKQHQEESQLRREQNRKRIEAERMKLNPLGLSDYQLEREKKLDEFFACRICGKKYTPRQYILSCGGKVYSNPGYCSIECKTISNKTKVKESHRGRRDSHRYRARKYGCEYDSSVTLSKLIKRNGLHCAICGGLCDLNDRSWSKHCGPMYPSIDHIIPMSKGGGHIWSNVQIAHIICNSEKGAEVR